MASPSGPTALAASYIKTLLSENSDFQTWVDHAGDAASALTHVYIGMQLAKPTNAPYVIIESARDTLPRDEIIGETFIGTVELLVIAGNDVPVADRDSGEDAAIFTDNEYDTLREILQAIRGGETSGVRVYFSIETVQMPEFPPLAQQDGLTRFEEYQMQFALHCGHGE